MSASWRRSAGSPGALTVWTGLTGGAAGDAAVRIAPVRRLKPSGPYLISTLRDGAGHREHEHGSGGQAPRRRDRPGPNAAAPAAAAGRTNGNARSGVGGVHALRVVRVPRRPASSVRQSSQVCR